ncbi:MAG TPA: HlyC/CorC family transporter [Chitinophagaceae bacterium]|nr:HlyC/CorC family transporter [Chitinophagaceae bacterium]
MDWIAIIAILISLLLVGFFTGIEVAFQSANKLSIELNKKQGTLSGRTWGAFSDEPAKFIGSLLVGLNVMLIIYGLLIGDMLLPVWKWIEAKLPASMAGYVMFIRLLVEVVLATSIILFVRFLGKAVFKARNNQAIQSNSISYISGFLYWLFASLSGLFISMSEWVLKYVFNVKLSQKKELFSKVDLEHFVSQSKSMDEEENQELNKELFENALSLSETKLRECLIPRKEIEAVDHRTDMETLRQKFIDSKLSKIVVYENNIDTIIGYVHHLDMLKQPTQIKDILHPIPTVPESMSATDLMNKFSRERKSIAWVIDEFGGTAGIVTMEDLLEEIFGEIEDEYDVKEEFIDKQISADEFIFSGRLELDQISEKYRLDFTDNDGAETLSGYIIQHHEAIPEPKERIIVGNMEFDILSVSGTRIETVKVKLLR